MDILISAAVGLAVGLLVGWFGHVLAVRRSKGDRAAAFAVEQWERCGEIASARVKYVLAFHRKASNASELDEAHKDLKRRYRWADPERIMTGVPEWEAYHDAERAALGQRPLSRDQIKAIDQLGYALFDAIGARRTEAGK